MYQGEENRRKKKGKNGEMKQRRGAEQREKKESEALYNRKRTFFMLRKPNNFARVLRKTSLYNGKRETYVQTLFDAFRY